MIPKTPLRGTHYTEAVIGFAIALLVFICLLGFLIRYIVENRLAGQRHQQEVTPFAIPSESDPEGGEENPAYEMVVYAENS